MTNSADKKASLKEQRDKLLKTFAPPRYHKVETKDIPDNILKAFKDKNSMYIWGDCGVGKTHTAYALKKYDIENQYKELLKKIDEHEKEGKDYAYNIKSNIKYYNFPNLLRGVKQSYDKMTSLEDGQITDVSDVFGNDSFWNTKEKPGILIFDDIGAEKFSEWTIENLYEIVNTCYEQMIPTILISNLSIKDLAEKVGDRIPSRISEMCEVIKLTGEDKRIK